MQKDKVMAKKVSAKTIIIGVGVAILIFVAMAIGVLVRLASNTNDQNPPPIIPKQVEELQTLLIDGKVDEAQAYIETAVQDPSTTKEVKYNLYYQQGGMFYAKGEYQKAIDAYTNASQSIDSYQVAHAIASAWLALGNKEKAIEFYTKAKTIIPEDYPTREDEIQITDRQIEMIREKQ